MAQSNGIIVKSGLLLWFLLSGTAADIFQEMPPQINSPRSQSQHIVDRHMRQHYRVHCNAIGHPPPRYQWTKDGIPLNDTQESIQAFENGTLYFADFSDSDNGLYQCLASNKYGTSVSVKLPLVNAKPAEKGDSTQKQISVQEVNEGQPISISCGETPPTVPKYNRRWYKSLGSLELSATEIIGIDSQGNLRFAFTQPGDDITYTCGLVPPILNPRDDIRMYNSVQLELISSKSVVDGIGPEIQFKSENVKVAVGKNVTLECFFSGKPAPTITWKSKGYGEITPNNKRLEITDFGRKLIIPTAKVTDEDVFACTAKNGFGSEQHQYINVNVTSPPKKIPHGGLTGMIRSDRHDITLQCKARAAFNESLNTPVWFQNGHLLDEANLTEPQRYNFNADHTELTIRNPNKTVDTASFQCNISNSEGYAFYDGYLKIIESIKIIKRPDERVQISRGHLTDISIIATGDNCCVIEQVWFFNGVRLTREDMNTPPFIRDLTTGTLQFDPDSVSNETLTARLGEYTCNVTNIYDFQEVKFNISLHAIATVPEELTAAAGGSQMGLVALICGVLVVLIAVIIIIVIIKTNFPGDTYELEKKELQNHLNPKEDLLEQSFQEI